MSKRCLDGCRWYRDPRAEGLGVPQIPHSLVASLASAQFYRDGQVDPAFLMGVSGFAFRIWINEVFCPSALSIFDWESIIPEAVRQAGRECLHITRMWHEEVWEEPRRAQAHEAILEAIEADRPVIAWNVAEPEWGLIIGYDKAAATYDVLSEQGGRGGLAFHSLGRNGIDILSVAIPLDDNQRSEVEVRRNALEAAVQHAEQRESLDRPKYQDGLPAFDLWATLFDRWAQLSRAGKAANIGSELPLFASIYARTYYSARLHARDYLRSIAGPDPLLLAAADSYAAVARCLRPVSMHSPKENEADPRVLAGIAADIREARIHEEEGIEHIRRRLEAGD
jgi:hypothetical protein